MNTTLNYRDTKSSRILVGKTAFFPVSPANIAAIAATAAPAAPAPSQAGSSSDARPDVSITEVEVFPPAPYAPRPQAEAGGPRAPSFFPVVVANPPGVVDDYSGVVARSMFNAATDAFTAGTPFNVDDWYKKNIDAQRYFWQIGDRKNRMPADWKVSVPGYWPQVKEYEEEMKGVISIIDGPGKTSGFTGGQP